MERLAVPDARARGALASGRGPDRVLIACGNQVGFCAGFFGLRRRVLPGELLIIFPRNGRLPPLPKLGAPDRKFETTAIAASHRGHGPPLGDNTLEFVQSRYGE